MYGKHKYKVLLDVWSTYLKDLRNLIEMLLVGVDFDTWHNSSYAASKSLGPNTVLEKTPEVWSWPPICQELVCWRPNVVL
jgi:hypothetical protein